MYPEQYLEELLTIGIENPKLIDEIIKIDDKNYITKGKYDILNPTTIRITELPIGKWTDDYKKFLDSLLPEVKKSKSLDAIL